MASYKSKVSLKRSIGEMIFLIRGQRIMLDFDLAEIYGVKVKRLNEQVRRNVSRLPSDFAFQLTDDEWGVVRSKIATSNLRSQIATSRQHGGRRYVPWAFTEHGAIMLASILNSDRAVEMSISVVRAFVLMRDQFAASKELAQKLKELEGRVSGHDQAITDLFEAIRGLVEPPLPEDRKQIGFMRETPPPYRTRKTTRA